MRTGKRCRTGTICPSVRPLGEGGSGWKGDLRGRQGDPPTLAMVLNPIDALLAHFGKSSELVADGGSDITAAATFRGTLVDFVLFPLDTVKTRMQSGDVFAKGVDMLQGIYRGLLPAVLASAPAGAAFFGTYDFVSKYLERFDANQRLAPVRHMIAAVSGDVAGSAVRVPFEVIKQNLQTGAYKTAAAAVSGIVSAEGVKGLYRGFGSLVIREMPFDLIEFPLYEALKVFLAKRSPDRRLPTWQKALAGSIAGGFASAVTTPLDVVKTRLMLQGTLGKYSGVRDALLKIYKEEGLGALYSGVVPRVIWISLGGFIFFGGYEGSKDFLSARMLSNGEEAKRGS